AGALIVRTRESVAARTVEQKVRQALLANDLPAGKIRTMEDVGIDSTARPNFNLLVLSLFAGAAVVLAGVGIYGVMAYNVEQRTLEMGIRAALGAKPLDVLILVFTHVLRLSVVGISIGVAASIALTPLLRAQ